MEIMVKTKSEVHIYIMWILQYMHGNLLEVIAFVGHCTALNDTHQIILIINIQDGTKDISTIHLFCFFIPRVWGGVNKSHFTFSTSSYAISNF